MTYLRARPTGNSRLSVAVMLSASVWAIACSDDPVAVAVADDFPGRARSRRPTGAGGVRGCERGPDGLRSNSEPPYRFGPGESHRGGRAGRSGHRSGRCFSDRGARAVLDAGVGRHARPSDVEDLRERAQRLHALPGQRRDDGPCDVGYPGSRGGAGPYRERRNSRTEPPRGESGTGRCGGAPGPDRHHP